MVRTIQSILMIMLTLVLSFYLTNIILDVWKQPKHAFCAIHKYCNIHLVTTSPGLHSIHSGFVWKLILSQSLLFFVHHHINYLKKSIIPHSLSKQNITTLLKEVMLILSNKNNLKIQKHFSSKENRGKHAGYNKAFSYQSRY